MAKVWTSYNGSAIMTAGGYGIGKESDYIAFIGGKKYPTVPMPDGNVWLSVNLDLVFPGLTVNNPYCYTQSDVMHAAYYDLDESTYGWEGTRDGLLYNWMAIDYMQQHKDELFPGWRVITTEFSNLYINVLGGSFQIEGDDTSLDLRSTSGWHDVQGNPGYNGNGLYGFNLTPSGYTNFTAGFTGIGVYGTLGTASEYSASNYTRYLCYGGDRGASGLSTAKSTMTSVRLVRNRI